ncbi:putative Zn-dependent protease [Kribbella orskensis]|uniref:Zn-dependent protease n=1 Tax=Kribbella orskensis TaxID=2512216 RepID=A0ABY2B8P7_9ACTN|nr:MULTISPECIES: metallopeptidase TldD-related protein [Kribbella]TCN31547.1 putative Zn-dependent protease [Kribbella sp. VKM Ac-2500]TCO11892.1 putative Zn-dependent protease [Kribbella orskensis]
MSIDQAEVARALEILGDGTRLDILGENADLLRYAESEITAQHSERRLRVRVRINRDGRAAAGSLETLDPDAVRTLADRLSAALADLPATSSNAPESPSGTNSGSTAPATPEIVPAQSVLESDPAVRHQWFNTVRAGLDSDMKLGGAIRYDVMDRVVADSTGLFRAETLTKASIQAIAKQDGRSASVKLLHRDADQIPIEEIPGRLREALTPLPSVDAHHGTCRVLLKPQAVNSLIATYGYAVLGANAYATGRSLVAGRLGEKITSELITLVDDGCDADGLPSGFDAEGNVRRRTTLIDKGVLTGVVSDQRRAGLTGGVPTGHAVPDGWRFGGDPVPSHLLLAPGESTEDELLAEVGSGLVVNRLDYLRVLHPKETLVTGTTRDATYWAEDGKLVGWHPQLRFTFKMDDVMNAILGVGAVRERCDQTFMESIVVPSLLIDAGPLVLP